ncbi:PAXIP1-associated glutamate-rich protein 1, partial [Onychostruthus taczanowskii]|uniref:PAXIP1-associated glutamate-rich protein 1 n=1 Tax=Onychostruthus taczanowskii TaxID=356909 RepID=UPI001B800DDD
PPKSPPKSPEQPQNSPGSPRSPPKPPDLAPNSPEEEWGVPWSEEEEEGAEPPGGWTPQPQEIRRLFEGIARAGTLPLRNVPFPRRQPTPEPPSLPELGADADASPGEEAQEEK